MFAFFFIFFLIHISTCDRPRCIHDDLEFNIQTIDFLQELSGRSLTTYSKIRIYTDFTCNHVILFLIYSRPQYPKQKYPKLYPIQASASGSQLFSENIKCDPSYI